MFHRMALLRFTETFSEEDEKEVHRLLLRIRVELPGVVRTAFGRGDANRGRGYTHGFLAVFESADAHSTYVPNRHHQAIGALFRARGVEAALLTFDDEGSGKAER